MSVKKFFLALSSVLCSSFMYAQMGINTQTPKSTLHIEASNTDASTAEGIIAPNLTRAQVISKDPVYTISQKGAIVYITDLSGILTTKTEKITTIGYYYFDGSEWTSFGGSGTNPWFIQGTGNVATNVSQRIYQMGGVNIGTTVVDSSAVLNIRSSDKGILFPQLTTAQRDNIKNPTVGLTIQNSDNNCIEQYRNESDRWYNLCSRTISGVGTGTLSCNNIIVNGPRLRLGEGVPTGHIISIPYKNGNGGAYSQQTFTSTGATGLKAILPAGNYNVGDGTLVFYITGTPTSSGTANFAITAGKATCSFQLEVVNTIFATNCDNQLGLNTPSLPLSTTLNIGGSIVNVSKKTSSTPGAIGVNPDRGFCGSSLPNDGSPVRIGRSSAAAISSITLIFSKPVNNVSIISNWYYTNDSHSVSTNSAGTITPINILSDCLANFAITGSGTSRVNIRCTSGVNNKGLTYVVNATKPYTEVTISNINGIDSNADDIIVAFAACDAYVAY
ncbi:MAG: hypothetical protein RL662_947 [Bacteroidota bacterium]|jgi:hypothetical protein